MSIGKPAELLKSAIGEQLRVAEEASSLHRLLGKDRCSSLAALSVLQEGAASGVGAMTDAVRVSDKVRETLRLITEATSLHRPLGEHSPAVLAAFSALGREAAARPAVTAMLDAIRVADSLRETLPITAEAPPNLM